MIKTTVRAAVVGATALATLVGTTTVAEAARSHSFSKSSGREATVEWLEVGTLPGGVLGNAHLGYLWVDDARTDTVNGWVDDFDCPEGVLPNGGGHDVPPEEQCTWVAGRSIDGGTIVFSMNKDLTSARLTGTLNVSNHGTPAGNPPVDMTWTGVGGLESSTSTQTYQDKGVFYTDTYKTTTRRANLTGNIGPMVFSDEAGEYTYASMRTYSWVSRSRTK